VGELEYVTIRYSRKLVGYPCKAIFAASYVKTTIMGFIKEFKEFAVKGNVMDLAIGVIIGGAFGKIVTALVANVITPIIAMFTGDPEKFNDVKLGPIKIGLFMQAVLDFIIIAFVLFLIVKAVNRFKAKTPEAAPAPTTTEVLLAEIRDELKKK
jgi:large conductance mechanosensitive channel